MPHHADLDRLIDLVRPATRIVVLTGAGISTESGIPDYRGPNGLWATQKPPTIGDYASNPDTRRTYWERRRDSYREMAARQPNRGHLAIAALERAGRLLAVVTQNIDGLHQRAGVAPDRVVELHGTTHIVRCMTCEVHYDALVIQSRLEAGEADPPCEACGGPLRSGTVLFGESLPKAALDAALTATRTCDLMLVVGTSLVVNPAARLPVIAQDHGARLAIVNRESTRLDARADVHVLGEAGPTLEHLAASIDPVQ
jgi:NAD-dependent deacetylase